MNTKEILNRLKVMLNFEDVKEQMAKATLVDGTEVYTEGELAPGSILYVVNEEGDVLAGEGMHETTDGLIVSVGPAGEIVSVEPKAPVEAMEKKKEEVEASKEKDKVEAMEDPMEEPKAEIAENLLEGMVELLKPFIAELKALKEEVEQAKVKMQEIADQPAASRIKNSAFKPVSNDDEVAAKLEKIKKIKNNK